MNEHHKVVIIGAGQVGLVTSYYLTQHEVEHIILEKASTVIPAWRSRWDSFALVLPNWTLNLPGDSTNGIDLDGFLDRDNLVATLDRFAASFNPRVRLETEVIGVAENGAGGYLVRTKDGVIGADNVVVAAGTFQKAKIPPFSANFDPKFTQLHTSEYHNPDDLPEGAVLVVGSGQSGCQIAEELYQNGRKVYLCIGGARGVPRRYRGQDIIHWLTEMGFFEATVDSLPSPAARFGPNPYVSGKDGGHTLNLHQFVRDGVVPLGHLKDVQGSTITLLPDMHENLAKTELFIAELLQGIDKLIADRNIDAPPSIVEEAKTDGFEAEEIEELDLEREGISTIIWATGYSYDFSWINLPVLDEAGYPLQERGLSEFPGLYFVGLLWLHNRNSVLLSGVADDAAYITADIASREGMTF